MYRKKIKNIIDFIGSLLGLIFFSPLLVVVTIYLFFTNRGKPFFFQIRPGKNGKLFKIIKFKTMNDKKDKFGTPLTDKERITLVGKIVRKISLDEIPQLINVLKGDMSLVGPRPLLPEYLSLYSEEQNKRHIVKPGLTGWAQINGRNAISWQRKFEYDVWYVENISFLLDLNIILKTIKKVFIFQDVNLEGQATTKKFSGNK